MAALAAVSVTIAIAAAIAVAVASPVAMAATIAGTIADAVPATLHAANAGAASDSPACHGATPQRRLFVVDEARTDPAVLEYAMAEAAAIWATAGVRLVWVPKQPNPPDAYLVLRAYARVAPIPMAAAEGRYAVRLGFVPVGKGGARPNLIIVLPTEISASIARWSTIGRALMSQPIAAQRRIAGRALGRVMAHEIGHWLVGRGHTGTGLMKAVLKPVDLVAHQAPRLPHSWTAGRGKAVAALHAGCAPAARGMLGSLTAAR